MNIPREAVSALAHKLRNGDWNLRAPQELADMIASELDALSEHGGGGEAVVVETVGFIREDGDGDLYIDWTVEGGIHELGEGCELIVSATKLTDDTGAGEVYTTPPTPSAPDRMAIKLLVTAGFITEAKANEALNIAHGFSKGSLSPPSAPVGDKLLRDLRMIAEQGEMPDGDGVPVNVRLWAEKHIATLTPPAAAPRVENCVWTLDDDEDCAWRSTCGEYWTFIDGTPEDNNCRFCHGCGKPVEIAASDEGEQA